MSLRFNKQWKFQSSGRAPIYSSPIRANVGGEECVVFQSWDWYIYVVRISDGSVKWKYATGAPCYGRCQAADVDSDGHTEVFASSHDGYVYCLNYDGTLRWRLPNLYSSTKASGVATSGGAATLNDTGKSWVVNCFTRFQGAGFGALVTITSGTGTGQTREIASNTATSLNTVTAWVTNPDATSHYTITPYAASDIFFQHAGTLQPEDVATSNAFSTWTQQHGGSGIAPVVTSAFANGPDGSVNTASRVQLNSGGGTNNTDLSRILLAMAVPNGSYAITVWMKTNNGANSQVTFGNNSGSPNVITVTKNWQKFTVITATFTGTVTPAINIDGSFTPLNSSVDLLVWNVEIVTYGLYVGGYDNIIRKVNPKTGAVLWEFHVGENIEAFPTLTLVNGLSGIIHCAIGSVDGKVYLLKGDDGTLLWSKLVDATHGEGIDGVIGVADVNGDGSVDFLVPVRRGGLVGGGGKVHYLKGTDGTDLFQTADLGGDIDNRPIKTNTGIVVGCDSGVVGSFGLTGATQWLNTFGQVINSSALYGDVDNDGVNEIIICDMNGTIYVIADADGKVKGQFMLDGPIEGIPYLDDETGDGSNMNLYVSTTAGSLFKVSVGTAFKMKISPDSASYNAIPGKTTQSTQLDGGMPRLRKDQLGAAEQVTVQWTTSQTGYDYLRAFYRTATQFGSMPFDIDLVIDGHSPSTYSAVFVPDTFQLSSQSGLTYVVQATLAVRPQTVNESADISLINAYVATT